jgi:dCMP deaminase
MYATMTPCSVRHCAHLIVACGIKKIVCDKKYHDAKESEEIFHRAGVEVVYLCEEVKAYQ